MARVRYQCKYYWIRPTDITLAASQISILKQGDKTPKHLPAVERKTKIRKINDLC